jgi:hypothetical protein
MTRKMTRRSLLTVVSIVSLTSACATERLEGQGNAVLKIGGCSQTTCGSNSPSLGAFKAAELHQDTGNPAFNQVNQDGLYLTGFADPQGLTAIYVVQPDGELVVSSSSGITYQGAGVTGSRFFVASTAPGAPTFTLTIDAYHDVLQYWVGDVETLPSYTISYVDDDSERVADLCPGPYTGPSIVFKDVVFSTGERYDFLTREVFATGAASIGWASLACVGDGPSKTLLYRHRPEYPAAHAYATSPEQRQALLRMFGADYCGNGDTYTVQGHPLEWQDRDGWMTSAEPDTHVEAIWGPGGVVCLDTPRMSGDFSKAQIEADCGVTFDSCLDVLYDHWQSDHYFKTWNP